MRLRGNGFGIYDGCGTLNYVSGVEGVCLLHIKHLQQTTMNNANALRRERKDALIERLLAALKDKQELNERVLGAAILGGILGFLIGIGW